MPRPRRIEGYAIVSEDGMLANAAGSMPDQLKFVADQQFFERGLDGVVVVVHGRHSHEQQPHSHLRRRLIFTRQVPTIAADPSNEKALFWNPGGASFRLYPASCRKLTLAKMSGWLDSLASVNTIAMRVVSAATTNGPRSFRKLSTSNSAAFCSLDLSFSLGTTESSRASRC
jgi:hypothetical protein